MSFCSAAPVRADTLPPLKPGLWETKATTNGVTRTTTACILEQANRGTNGLSDRHCHDTVTRTTFGYEISMRCAFGPAIGEIVTRVTGDFETTVRMEGVMTPYNPRPSEPTTIGMLTEMRRLGPCEAKQK